MCIHVVVHPEFRNALYKYCKEENNCFINYGSPGISCILRSRVCLVQPTACYLRCTAKLNYVFFVPICIVELLHK